MSYLLVVRPGHPVLDALPRPHLLLHAPTPELPLPRPRFKAVLLQKLPGKLAPVPVTPPDRDTALSGESGRLWADVGWEVRDGDDPGEGGRLEALWAAAVVTEPRVREGVRWRGAEVNGEEAARVVQTDIWKGP